MRDSQREEKEKAKTHKACLELKKQIAALRKVCLEKGDNIANWNTKDCKLFIQYKKVEGDAAMPTRIDDLRVRCQLIAQRPSPIPSPHSSDDEGDSDDSPDDAPFLTMLAEVSESGYI